MFSSSDSESRIARQLRWLEAATVVTTVAAFVVTVVMVRAGLTVEANPVTRWGISTFGWASIGAVAVLFEAACFECYCRYSDYPRAVTAGAVLLALFGSLDLGVNLAWVWAAGLPETTHPQSIRAAVVVSLVGAGVLSRDVVFEAARQVAARRPRRSRWVRPTLTLVIVVLVVVSPIAGPLAGVIPDDASPVQPVAADSTATEQWFDSEGSYAIQRSESGDRIFQFGTDSNVRAFDSTDGSVMWTTGFSSNSVRGLAYDSNSDTLMVSYLDGNFDEVYKILDASNGDVLHSNSLGNNDFSNVKSYDGKYYYSNGTHLNIIDPTSGDVVDDFEPNSQFKDHFVVGNGKIFLNNSASSSASVYDANTLSKIGELEERGVPKAVGAGYVVTLFNKSWGGSSVIRIFDSSDYSLVSENTSYSFPQDTNLMIHNGIEQTITSDGIYHFSTSDYIHGIYANNGSEKYRINRGDIDFGGISAQVVVEGDDGNYEHYVTDSSSGDGIGRYDSNVSVGPSQVSSSTNTISGRVLNQNGDPVRNATVEAWAVDKSKLTPSASQSLTDRADEVLEQAKDPFPDSWNPDKQLAGNNAFFANAEANYAAVTQKGVSDAPLLLDSADLSEPKLVVDSSNPAILTVWDPSQAGVTTDSFVAGEYTRQLPGQVQDEGTVVIESVAGTGETVDRIEAGLNSTVGGGFADPSQLNYAEVDIPPGVYRVYPEGSPETAYTIVAAEDGDPSNLAGAITENLKDQANTLTEQADTVQQRLTDGVFTRTTVTTNATGHFSVSTSANTIRVGVQAYKKPDALDTDPQNVTLDEMRSFYRNTDYNGSFVTPSRVRLLSVPTSDAEITVREVDVPQFSDLSKFQDAQQWWEDFIRNHSMSEAATALQQRLENVTSEDLREYYRTLLDLTEQNTELEERARENLRERVSDPTTDPREIAIDLQNATNADLRERINAMQQSMAELRDTVEATDSAKEVAEETVDLSWDFGTDLTEENAAVLVHYTNGTTETLNASTSPYVSVNSATVPGTDSTVELTDFPRRDEAARFEAKVATEDGLGSASTRVPGLGANGSAPTLSTIDLSTLYPGPDEEVTMKLSGGEDTVVTSVDSITAYAPDGTEVDANVTGARTATWNTSGAGVHVVKATFATDSGQQATVTYRVEAGQQDQAMPGAIRAMDSPLGTIALTGDGLDGGEIDTEAGGSQVNVLANVGDSVPPKVHVYTAGASVAPSTDITVRLVRGPNDEAVSRQVPVTLHLAASPADSAIAYANDAALPREGENPSGRVTQTAGSTTIESYTDSSGVLTIQTEASPGLLARLNYVIDTQLSGLPDVPVVGTVSTLSVGGFIVAPPRRRRREAV
jgi:hypothetical protein